MKYAQFMSPKYNWEQGQLKTYTSASLSFYTNCVDIHFKSRIADILGNARAHFLSLFLLN